MRTNCRADRWFLQIESFDPQMDELDLWQDTLLIVTTDHGFLLGEHASWGKIGQPYYNDLPIRHYSSGSQKRQARRALPLPRTDDRHRSYVTGLLRS